MMMTKENIMKQLADKANRLQTQINLYVAPFVDETHPAYHTLQEQMVRKAKKQDYSLIESVNRAVELLTAERVEVMNALNKLREEKS